MSCPACSEALSAGQERCPACGALLSLPVEGALAPDPALVAPPEKVEPLRAIPALKRKEPSWKDEVRERVRHRKRQRGGPDLPLFPEEEEPADAADAPAEQELRHEAEPADAGPALEVLEPPAAPLEAEPASVLDLPLHAVDAAPPPDAEQEPARAPAREPTVASWREPPEDVSDRPAAVERPAQLAERFQAGAIDALILAGAFSVVIYFASRAARVPLGGLLPTWPYLLGYLAFLGLVYAGYFTGLRGQTPGKMLIGLRVVDRAGDRPGLDRASLRAILGVFGIAAALLGILPMLLDPARRALHDRVVRTRVIRI